MMPADEKKESQKCIDQSHAKPEEHDQNDAFLPSFAGPKCI
jgi:hypothetical protein